MAMALGIVGAAVSAIGSIQQAQATANAAEYNAKRAERNATMVREQTDAEITDARIHNRRVIGSMRAAYGANGFEMAGSPMDVMSDTLMTQEWDIAKTKYQGEVKAQGYTEQATLSKMEAESARTAGFIGAASSLLGGIGGIASNSGASFSLMSA